MKSLLLKEIYNRIYLKPYDFRYAKVGDKVKNYIEENLKKDNVEPKEIYSSYQCHSTNISIVERDKAENFIYGKIFLNSDGMITSSKNVGLFIKFADCTPLVLYERENHILGIVHSGWRGTSKKIGESLIEKILELGGKRENILAYVGPSIDSKNYEVGKDVYDAFDSFNTYKNFKKSDIFISKDNKNEKFLLNMKKANKIILENNGIKNIEVSKEITFDNINLHSARRDGKNYGLNGMMVMMR